MEPLILKWSKHFTCIAPDHPGFGLSDPSGQDSISMDEMATALVEVMDALGIDKTAVYGVHTGACIAVALAAAAPERIWATVANGYVVVTDEERADLLDNYLPAMPLKADGSHLSWLWWRVREKLAFAPWYRTDAENRIQQSLPDLDELQDTCLEMLRTNDQYRIGYRAAFTFDAQKLIERVQTPTLIIAAEQDTLAKHVRRIQQPPDQVQLQNTSSFEEAEKESLEFLLEPGSFEKDVFIDTVTSPLPSTIYNEMTQISDRQLRVQRYQGVEGKPVLLLHDSIGSVEVIEDISRSFTGLRPTIAIDLPGQGESDKWPLPDKEYITGCTEEIVLQMTRLGIEEFDCVAIGTGGHLGIELQKLAPGMPGELAIIDPCYLDPDQKRQFLNAENARWKPRWDGGHLMETWYRMRDEALFWPWFQPDQAKSIYQESRLGNQYLQQRVIAFLKAPERTLQSMRCHAEYSFQHALKASSHRGTVCAAKWSP